MTGRSGTSGVAPLSTHRALDAVLDALDGVESLAGASNLRNLADCGGDLALLLDEVRTHQWALEELDDIRWAFEGLVDLEGAVRRVADLWTVADDVDDLVAAMRRIRRHRDELDDAVEHAWAEARRVGP